MGKINLSPQSLPNGSYTKDASELDMRSLKRTVYSSDKTIYSTLEQLATSISLKVSKDSIINEINVSTEGIKLLADRITLEGIITANNNFKILADGSIEAVNGTFSGTVTTGSGSVGGLTLATNTLTAGVMKIDTLNKRIYLGSSAYFYPQNNTDWMALNGNLFISQKLQIGWLLTDSTTEQCIFSGTVRLLGDVQITLGGVRYHIARDSSGFLHTVAV